MIPDDLIVQGSLCTGLDCVNNESFGFNTLRLKENNTEIAFDDTSMAAGFAANDWILRANDSPSGGANRFMVIDSTAGRIPFSIFAGAPADALVVTAGGEVRAATFLSQVPATEAAAPADGAAVLAALRSLTLSTAAYAPGADAPRHLGPSAGDFRAAFGVGADNGRIAPSDMAGAALAAVKALDARVTTLAPGAPGRRARRARRARRVRRVRRVRRARQVRRARRGRRVRGARHSGRPRGAGSPGSNGATRGWRRASNASSAGSTACRSPRSRARWLIHDGVPVIHGCGLVESIISAQRRGRRPVRRVFPCVSARAR